MYLRFLMGLCCMISLQVSARQVVTGNVKDKELQKPVEQATVELLRLPDSALVEKVQTNSDGFFTLYKSDTTRQYCLRVGHVSYKTMVFPLVRKSTSMINNQGILSLEPKMYNFKELVVSGSKIGVTELPDRTVYAMPEDLRKTSTDGLDVLRKVPAIQVNYFDESVTVDGKSNIKIEVDGVTRDKDYLKKIHPTQIEKLEVITSPSGKYDAEVDAIINVITNPEMRYGLKGMVNTQLLPNDKNTYMGRFNGNIDYGFKKISYYIAGNAGAYAFAMPSTLERSSGNTLLLRTSTQGSEYQYGNLNAGIIANPDDVNNVNLSVSYKANHSHGDGDVFNYSSQNNVLTRIYQTSSNSESSNGNLNSSLFYKHKFDKDTRHAYEVEMNYSTNIKNKSVTHYQNIEYNLDTTVLLPGDMQTEENQTYRQSFDMQGNYTLPFDSVYTFMIGASGNYNQYKVDNTSTVRTSPGLDYQEVRGGAFTELARSFAKGSSVKVGSRFEASQVTIASANINQYFSALPYANGQYKINATNSIKGSYSRRVIRPSSAQLNPFVSVVDSQTIKMGNVNLKPAYRDNFQLTYNLKLGKKKLTVSLSPQVFYEYRTKLIQNVLRSDSGRFVSMPQNVSNGYVAGGALALNAQIGFVMLNSNFRYSYTHTDAYLNQITAMDKESWSWNSYAVCPLPKNIRFFTVLNLQGPSVNGQDITKISPFYLFGVVKQFKNNSSVNVFVLNPFSRKMFNNKTTTSSTSFYQRSESYMDIRPAIMINYTYSFKIGKDLNLQKRDGDDFDEGMKLPF